MTDTETKPLWEDFKRKETRFLIFTLGYLPFGILLKVTSWILGFDVKYIMPFLLIWFLAAGWSFFERSMRECPVCKELFYEKNKFASKCTHCGATPQ